MEELRQEDRQDRPRPTANPRQAALAAMLEARSVAVVGASAREGSFGHMMMTQLIVGGYEGSIYPVNPSHREVLGHACYPSVDALPESVDLAMLGVRNDLLEEALSGAAAAGARSAAIFASCMEAPRPGVPPLHDRLATIAGQTGMAVCGGNCMGFVNFEHRLRACGFSEPAELERGPITFISHSGSAFSALLHNDRELRFNLVVSAGTEMATTAADYLRYALELDGTRIVGLFIEAVRDPEGFRAALALAADRDVPVVALKVGREPAARELVAAHSGALAGEDGAYEALFDAYGVLRVKTLDELADTVELMVAGRRAGPGGLSAIHDSGGERAHLIDSAAEAGVGFARIGRATEERLAAVLEEGLPPVNPLDAWGTGTRADEIFLECMHALLDDPDTSALAFCVDLTTELVSEAGYARVANEVFAKTEKPVAVLSNMAAAIDRRDAAFVRRAGMPVLEGTTTGLAAFRHLFEYRDHRARPPVQPPHAAPPHVVTGWRKRLASAEPASESEALSLLADYGITVTAGEVARTAEGAAAAAERIGWPVALKTAVPGIDHKSEVGGVKLGLANTDDVATAYDDLAGRLGPEVMVAALVPEGVEIALGVVRDPQFGPLVMVGAGGVLVELLRDRRFSLPPLDAERAMALLDGLAVRRLLDGVRGAPPVDLDAVADAVARLSVLALDLGDLIEALDVNPVIARPEGCVAVDARLYLAR